MGCISLRKINGWRCHGIASDLHRMKNDPESLKIALRSLRAPGSVFGDNLSPVVGYFYGMKHANCCKTTHLCSALMGHAFRDLTKRTRSKPGLYLIFMKFCVTDGLCQCTGSEAVHTHTQSVFPCPRAAICNVASTDETRHRPLVPATFSLNKFILSH